MEFGHADARRYTVIKIWNETRIVRQRLSERRRLDAVVAHAVTLAGSGWGGKDAFDHLKKTLEDIEDGY